MEAPSEPLEGTTLHHLLSKDENRLLDTIDELRSQGVGKLLGEKGLPQIIVCGDQSSGKSSVLEALTRVRFPTRSSVCTTFPTELRLRREPSSRISCRIKPSANRSKEEKERLARFTESFQSPERFPDLITAARKCMSESSDGANRGHGSIGGFFEDVLEVEIVGPKMAPLTIVDLPGLIHYRNASTGDNDIKLVRELVERYMKLDNSIILAVVSAHNDISNQVVLNQIEKTVQDGKRTLGIITKPDELPAGSEKEDEYLEHARMNPNKFQYGWHVVRNRSYEEQSSSFDERDETEKRFFSSSSWASLPRRQVGLGIDSLRQKLSKMLLDHISTSLPSIVQQLEADFNQSEAELAKLGEARSKPKDQYNYLSDISDNFGEYVKDALSGRYHRKSFFGDPLSPEGLEKRLRANIRNLNDEFATRMLERGHKWHVVEDAEMLNIRLAPRSKQVPDHPNVMSKSDFLKDFVDTLAYRERGNELPGMSNPLLVGSLFRQQSEPWRDMAMEHLDTVWIAVKDFLEALLAHLTDERTCKQLLIHVIHPAMEERQQSLSKKLEELMVPHRDQDPLDINPQFVRKILSQREKRVAKTVIEQLQKDCDVNGAKTPTIPTVDQVMAKLEADSPPVDNKYGSLESFEFMQAYYESTILIFINNVASLAVEQCLLAGLPKIFSSPTIREMDLEKVELIATESHDTLSERDRLSKRVKVLQKGLQTIRMIQPGTHTPRNKAKENRTSPVSLPYRASPAAAPVKTAAGKPTTSGKANNRPPSVLAEASLPPTPNALDGLSKPQSLFSNPSAQSPNSKSATGTPRRASPSTGALFGKNPDGKSVTTGFGLASSPASGLFGKNPDDKSATTGFGATSSSTGGLFGKTPDSKSVTGGFGSTPSSTGGLFGQNPNGKSSTTGFGTTSSSTGGLFGKTPDSKSVTGGVGSASSPASGLFGQNNTAGFGSASTSTGGFFGNPSTSKSPQFDFYSEEDPLYGLQVFQALIGFMPPYENVSFEETRLEDYQNGQRWAD